MLTICESDLLTATAVTYLLAVTSLGAFIFTTIGHAVTVTVSLALLFSLLVAAALLAGATLALPGAGPTARACVVAATHIAFAVSNMFVSELGFLAALSHSLFALAVCLVGKLADGTDEEFHVTKSSVFWVFRGLVLTVDTDYASALCFFVVIVVTVVVHRSRVEPGRGGYPYSICYNKAD